MINDLSNLDGPGPKYHSRGGLPSSRTNRAVLLPIYGQSNALGGGARDLPSAQRAVSVVAPYPNLALTMSGGPVYQSENLDSGQIVDLQPLAESRRRESPATAMARWLIARDISAGREPRVHIAEAHGKAGTKLARLMPDSGSYITGLNLWQKATTLAAQYGLPGIWAPSLHLDHGEADRATTSRGRYNTFAKSLRVLIESDLRSITGQSEPVWMIMSQLASAAGNLTAEQGAWTALSQLDLMQQEPRTTIAMPSYFFQKDYGMLGVHFRPLGHALRGEYHAKAGLIVRRAIERVTAMNGDPWCLTNDDVRTCLRPDLNNITRDGISIYIPLQLPEDGKRVILDDRTLPPADNLGFSLSAGTDNKIVNVSLRGGIIVVILESPSPVRLRYACDNSRNTSDDRSGAWGNFRDDCSEVSLAVSGVNLWNWLVSFDVLVG